MSTELIYGIHAVSALLERTPDRFIEVWALKGREDERLQPVLAELEALGIRVQSVNRKTLDDKAEGNNHQGIMAKVIEAPKLAEHDLASLLDGLADRFCAELGAQTAFYATGDLPRSIREACRTPIHYRETLITDGLHRIWLRNRKG